MKHLKKKLIWVFNAYEKILAAASNSKSWKPPKIQKGAEITYMEAVHYIYLYEINQMYRNRKENTSKKETLTLFPF